MKRIAREALTLSVSLTALIACSDESGPSTANAAINAAAPQGAAAVADGPPEPAWTVLGTPVASAPPALNPHTAVAPRLTKLIDSPLHDGWQPILSSPAVTPGNARAPEAAPDLHAGGDEAARMRTAEWWSAGAVLRWNEIARTLTARYRLNSSNSSRLFAALAVAQHDAARAARARARGTRIESIDFQLLKARGSGFIERRNAPSQEAAIAHASAGILKEFFPQEPRFIEQNAMAHVDSRIWMGASLPAAAEAGRRIGEDVAQAVATRIRADGSRDAQGPRVPQQAGRWYSEEQTLPGWSRVVPWVMERPDQFRAPPPPERGSPGFLAAVQEIRTFSDRRSAEQLAIAWYWNLGAGGISMPGMWDQVALEHAHTNGWPELKTARLMAVLNMAMFDACIAAWDTKYHYLVPRPSMMDPRIDEPLGLPPHPSYTSAHSAFAGAAEGVLSAAFPAKAEEFHRLAEEASASRFFGGIHYRFDGDQGLIQGRKVAGLVLQKFPL